MDMSVHVCSPHNVAKLPILLILLWATAPRLLYSCACDVSIVTSTPMWDRVWSVGRDPGKNERTVPCVAHVHHWTHSPHMLQSRLMSVRMCKLCELTFLCVVFVCFYEESSISPSIFQSSHRRARTRYAHMYTICAYTTYFTLGITSNTYIMRPREWINEML